MKRIYYLEKYKDFLTIKIRFLLVNFLILTSLCFVVLKNIDKLRYKVIFDENEVNLLHWIDLHIKLRLKDKWLK